MRQIQEHKFQVYLVGLQALAIIAGSLIVTGYMKVFGTSDNDSHQWPWVLRMIRSYGFLLLLIPAAWAYLTVKLEINERIYYRPVWTIISGVVILAALAWLFCDSFMTVITPVYP